MRDVITSWSEVPANDPRCLGVAFLFITGWAADKPPYVALEVESVLLDFLASAAPYMAPSGRQAPGGEAPHVHALHAIVSHWRSTPAGDERWLAVAFLLALGWAGDKPPHLRQELEDAIVDCLVAAGDLVPGADDPGPGFARVERSLDEIISTALP